ncbi:hypothetical protein ACCO45_011882 [Purpureocillium lilacinum]|uniref:Uncharacterized protein n=1 Tax=Purpureocillium lilacinum TaxID=33203 RepID=A0ACC4DC44_PURLI
MLATSCAADWLHAFESCYMEGNDFGCWRSAVFYTDYGAYDFNNANSGCYGIPVPGMVEFCLDTVEKRAHFRFEGQGKRCLRKDRAPETHGEGLPDGPSRRHAEKRGLDARGIATCGSWQCGSATRPYTSCRCGHLPMEVGGRFYKSKPRDATLVLVFITGRPIRCALVDQNDSHSASASEAYVKEQMVEKLQNDQRGDTTGEPTGKALEARG